MVEFDIPSTAETSYIVYDIATDRFMKLVDISAAATWHEYSKFVTHFPTVMAAKREMEYIQHIQKNRKLVVIEVQITHTFKEVK